MNDNMTPEQKRLYNKQERKRKFWKYWLVYLALIGTGTLSAISGFLLPASVIQSGIEFSTISIFAGIYYAIGFLSNGEGAAYFWFDKLTDHDEDNTPQIWIAGCMLGLSVITITVTALAAGSFIAFIMGALSEFQIMPAWAQKWVVWTIPVFWVIHFSAGVAFKAFSDEAASERSANAKIRNIMQKITSDKADARARYWQENAPDLARRLGELEAEEEIKQYSAKLNGRDRPNA